MQGVNMGGALDWAWGIAKNLRAVLMLALLVFLLLTAAGQL
jgi:hypothetical protein